MRLPQHGFRGTLRGKSPRAPPALPPAPPATAPHPTAPESVFVAPRESRRACHPHLLRLLPLPAGPSACVCAQPGPPPPLPSPVLLEEDGNVTERRRRQSVTVACAPPQVLSPRSHNTLTPGGEGGCWMGRAALTAPAVSTPKCEPGAVQKCEQSRVIASVRAGGGKGGRAEGLSSWICVHAKVLCHHPVPWPCSKRRRRKILKFKLLGSSCSNDRVEVAREAKKIES